MKLPGKRTFVGVLLGCVLVATHQTPVRAGEPMDKIRQTVDAVLAILSDESLNTAERTQERREKIRQTVLARFGFEQMAQRALGRHWRSRTPAERADFVDLFSNLLERSYIDKIESYGGSKGNVRYTKETVDQDGYAIVRSEIVGEHGQSFEVEYRLLKHQGDWQVYDVVIESVSLVNNYRTQFNKIIIENSFADLMKKMKLKLEQEEAATKG